MNELAFSASALRHLDTLREHPHAPSFNFASSDMLNHQRLSSVRAFEGEVASSIFWAPGAYPNWMADFLARVFATVPLYERSGAPPADLVALPTTSRADLAERPEKLVPRDVPLGELTVYTTTGTSGTSLPIPTDPAVSSKVLVLMDSLLRRYGVRLPRGAERVAVAALFFQNQTLTYPSLSRYLDGAATLKLNLHPREWRRPEDRARYLTELAPAVVTGCPSSLAELQKIAPQLRPEAILSSAVSLSEGLKMALQETFHCPVVDVYSLTEAKFLAASHDGRLFEWLCPDTYVEIVDPSGRPLPPGERGEITVTGGRNRFWPLVRYRTGDHAALVFRGGQPCLVDFHGRTPVTLVDGQGEEISSLDVIHCLRAFPLVGFSFSQAADRAYSLQFCGQVAADRLEEALKQGLGLTGRAEAQDCWTGKPHQFQ